MWRPCGVCLRQWHVRFAAPILASSSSCVIENGLCAYLLWIGEKSPDALSPRRGVHMWTAGCAPVHQALASRSLYYNDVRRQDKHHKEI